MLKIRLAVTVLLSMIPAISSLHAADFETLDTNHDMVLTDAELAAEIARLKATLQAFEAIDTNHDGTLSVEEFKAYLKAQSKS